MEAKILKLNIRQRKVVEAKEPKILCLAAASSGKTRTLTERIKYLIEQCNVAPKDIVGICFTNAAAEEMKNRLGDICIGSFIGTVHSYANSICIYNGIDTSSYTKNFEFDKIIEKANTLSSKQFIPVEHLLVDECQDIGPLEYAFLEKIPAKNQFWCGDDRQCQPAGTKVLLRNNVVKNIEDIKVGDSICYYDTNRAYSSGMLLNASAKEKKVLKTAVRDFCNDELITITTESGLQSTYTPNHKTFVRLSGTPGRNHAVYLMCDDNYRFRVGKIPWTASNNAYHLNPWRDKMYKEGCTKIWILKTFETDKDARVFENKISYTYGIPQICWQQDKVMWTEEDINYIYEELDTYKAAKECLKKYHRDINYPLLDKSLEGSEKNHFARNALAVCFAANLMDEGMEVLIYDKNEKKRKRYEKIVNIEYKYITDPIPVYSLEVEGGNYFADEILTHNCIYGFKGSSLKYLENFYYDDNYKKYYLTENYRNTPDILAFAEDFLNSYQSLSPKSVVHKTRRGIVEKCSFYEALDELEIDGNWGDWFILTRTNNELAAAQELLDEKGIPNVTFKRGDLDLIELEELMNSNRVKVLTIHTSKGLQNRNVIVTGARLYCEEERKIAYVAATRAENALYWCPSIAKRHKKGEGLNKKAEAGRFTEKTQQQMVFF